MPPLVRTGTQGELLCPYRSECVQPHWDLTIRMKRWAAIERPNLIVPILLGFEVFSFGYFDLNTTPSRRSLNLPCQWWKNYPCFDRGTHKWPKVGGPHIVWSQDITPCDTSIWWIFEFLCLWHYLFLSHAVSYSSTMLLLGIQEKNLTRRMPFNTSPCPNNEPIGMFHSAWLLAVQVLCRRRITLSLDIDMID